MARHIRAFDDVQLTEPSIVTIGMFDGVHLGHQRLIRRLVDEAQQSHRTSVVLTFFPHPDVVIKGVSGRYYLTSPEERADRILGYGVDLVVTQEFNEAVRQVRAADYVRQLQRHLNLATLWVGPDFALGYKREGDVDFLRAQGAAFGFTVETVDLKMGDNPGTVISSSHIREALLAGDVNAAAALLGHPYDLTGEVVLGDQRGRQLGFPTANLDIWEGRLLPANGVYACWAFTEDGVRHPAVTNIGVRPTFDGVRLLVEAHLLDFDADIYGQELRVAFQHRLRDEMRFDGIEALVAQIKRDVSAGRSLLPGSADRS